MPHTRRHIQHNLAISFFLCGAVAGCSQFALGQLVTGNATPRIAGAIDETKWVTLTGNAHRVGLDKYDQGALPESFHLDHLYLQLRRSPEQDQALEYVLRDLQTPSSANYHQWLSAQELGKSYGPAQADIDAVVYWLNLHGLQVNQVFKSGMIIDVSATVGQIHEAFRTEIHKYQINGRQHIANASDPQIPAALAPVVAGFNSLNDFLPKSLLRKPRPNFSFPCTGCPDGFAGQEQYYEAPADFAIIYNVAPLYKDKNPITGKGQTVVVLEDTDMLAADVVSFRSAFGLSSYSGTFKQIHPGLGCSDPGLNGDEDEAALDAEWAGAVAPDAAVDLASCADTQTNFGGYIAAQNLLNTSHPPPIMSSSYGACEAQEGPAYNAYLAELWREAALEGVSVFVAAGDGGPDGCDDFDTALYAVSGIGVDGDASTPYDVATGGTDFLDTLTNQNGKYWNTINKSARESAKSYIPEMPWNQSCAGSVLFEYFGFTSGLEFCNSVEGSNFLDIVGGSGGPSFIYGKPSWQKNVYGMPDDGKRDLPDVSLFASVFLNHAIVYCMSDENQGGAPCNFSNAVDAFYNSAGGTSFTAPQFASIQALINQKAGGTQGNPAPTYYELARAQYGTSAAPNKDGLTLCNSTIGDAISPTCIFSDVTAGNNNIPCYGTQNCYGSTGATYGILSTSDRKLQLAYPAQTGWDFGTGLGTVNVTNLVKSWP